MSGEIPKGGSFLVEKVGSRKIFTPEDFNDEQKAMAETARKFLENEMLPKKEQIDHKEPGVLVELMKKAGELGLLMVSIPQEYGGLGMDKTTFVLVSEVLAPEASSFVSISAHTCIGAQPLIFFGNEEQKQKYLPKLASGEMIAAYGLTETGAGSDAMGLKSKAVLSKDGKSYILNGGKQFITNGGICDLVTVFAHIDGDRKKSAAFLVERGFPGFSSGVEEKKMGIKGSSTTSMTFEDCRVPVENLLGEVGEGGRVAFNVLDLGRLQVGSACAGAAKWLIKQTIQYAKDRVQFKKPIIEFGMVKRMLADSVALTFATETIAYRSTQLIDQALEAIPADDPEARKKKIIAIGNFAPECSIVKVFGSEALDSVADMCLQIYGGYGFTEEYPAEKIVRDCRVNRIFEGTNEINRQITIGSLLRSAMKNEIPLLAFIQQIMKELKENKLPQTEPGPLGDAMVQAELSKRLMLYATNLAFQKLGEKLQEEQIALELLADMAVDCYCLDSACARVLQLVEKRGESGAKLGLLLAKIICFEGHSRVGELAKKVVVSLAEPNQLEGHLENIAKLSKPKAFNLIQAKHQVAEIITEQGEYRI